MAETKGSIVSGIVQSEASGKVAHAFVSGRQRAGAGLVGASTRGCLGNIMAIAQIFKARSACSAARKLALGLLHAHNAMISYRDAQKTKGECRPEVRAGCCAALLCSCLSEGNKSQGQKDLIESAAHTREREREDSALGPKS